MRGARARARDARHRFELSSPRFAARTDAGADRLPRNATCGDGGDAARAAAGAPPCGTRFVGRPGREAVEAPNLDACEWYSTNRSAAGAPAASPAVAPLPHL